MNRRSFIKTLCFIPTVVLFKHADASITQSVKKSLIQHSSLAGFQFYQGEQKFQHLSESTELELQREKHNRYDSNAIRINWQGHQLGYIPRDSNSDLAKRMDNGEQLSASITKLRNSSNPWKRIEVAIYQLG